jgi:hypothetical protein
LGLAVVAEIASALAPYPRDREPRHVVADVLLRLLPMPECARSTVALVVHRHGTGTCDDLTYNQAGALGGYDRRTAIQHFARTESYGLIRVEQRGLAYGGAGPNVVTARIPAWVYEQVEAYRATSPAPADPEGIAATAAGGPEMSSTSMPAREVVPVAIDIAPTGEPTASAPPPAVVLAPEDAAIDALLAEIHAFTHQRFQVAAVRGLNGRAPAFVPGAGVPGLDDEQLLAALGEYIAKQRPEFERRVRYGERFPDRRWVERGVHIFLWQKRARLDGLDGRRPAPAARKSRSNAPSRSRRPVSPRDLPILAAPVRLGADLETGSTVVRTVLAGSLAASLGFQAGDKLVRVDDRSITSLADLRGALHGLSSGRHTFEVQRGHEVVVAAVTLDARGPPPA